MVVGAQKQITQTVLAWPGTTSQPHRFGGTEYRLSTREIGHIHGDHMLDIPFPSKVRNQIVEAGRAEPHHLLPESGWISFYIRMPDDIPRAIALLQESYTIAQTQRARRKAQGVEEHPQ
jgi:hypothetical protein